MNYTDMGYTASPSRTNLELGSFYKTMILADREFLDAVIKGGCHKIATIKALKDKLGITLSEAKRLYEARYDFLNSENTFGW